MWGITRLKANSFYEEEKKYIFHRWLKNCQNKYFFDLAICNFVSREYNLNYLSTSIPKIKDQTTISCLVPVLEFLKPKKQIQNLN